MGEERKKKKGRPSLLDLRKRALKQQQSQHQQQDDLPIANHRLHISTSRNPNSLNHPPNSASRSKRRNPNRNCVYSWIKYDEDAQDYSDEDYDDRREKKHRLLHGLNSHSHRRSSNSQSSDGGSDLNLDDTPVSRHKITAGSDFTQGEKASKATDILRGSPVESGPTTPLPDKKLLVFILDRLQKKDTYGVYSDPVDPEELPDYHDIITNPMDFSTVRKKLDSGAYASLEQFERDVFLICTNAMEYNSADTVYYRQARAIQELAKKDFENLRRDSDNEPQNQQQQQPEPSSIDHTASEVSADALIPGGDSSNKFSGAYNLRKTPSSSKFRQGESLVRINHNSENQSDWETEFPRKANSAFFQTYFGQYEPSLSFSVASVVKAVNKYGMKHSNVDDNRRDTYNHLSTFTQEPSVLTTFEDELKELIPVGVNTEYGYAMSLARYAANLGSVAWKTASRRIETVLPSGMKFGLGWVGENPAGPGEDYSRKQNLRMSSRKQKCSNDLSSDDNSKRILSPTCSVSSAFIGNRHSSSQGIEETVPPPARVLNPETDHPSACSTCQSGPLTNPESRNGLIRGLGGFSHNANQMLGMVRQRQPNLTKEATQGSQQGLLFPYNKQEFHRFPLDLNARIVSPNSPGSNPQAGSSSSQHPDLALQLWR